MSLDPKEIEGLVVPEHYVKALEEAFPDEPAQSEPEPAVEAKAEEAPETVETPETNTPEEDLDVESMDKPQVIDLGFDDIKEVLVDVGEDAVTVSSLKDGYMRNADYTRKTQSLSADKREVDVIRTQYAQGLDFLNQQAGQALSQYESVDWETLKMSDPANYQTTLKEYQEVQQAVNGVTHHRDAFIQKANEDREAANKRQASESNDILKNIIPDWGSEKYSNCVITQQPLS